jgi:hypothetical protein
VLELSFKTARAPRRPANPRDWCERGFNPRRHISLAPNGSAASEAQTMPQEESVVI